MISTHILDTSRGNPATGVLVILEWRKDSASAWQNVAQEKTNADGRAAFPTASEVGLYRFIFHIENYFANLKQEHFFQNAEISFKISDSQRKYHIPLLMTAYGYSTYRGS